jgi:hypothetical protein
MFSSKGILMPHDRGSHKAPVKDNIQIVYMHTGLSVTGILKYLLKK